MYLDPNIFLDSCPSLSSSGSSDARAVQTRGNSNNIRTIVTTFEFSAYSCNENKQLQILQAFLTHFRTWTLNEMT